MLSNTNMATSSIQKRRTQHRRQNSTPAAFEAPKVPSLPAHIQRHSRHRTGLSLDLRGFNLEAALTPERGSIADPITPVKIEPFQQDDSTVSITNIGQPQQHQMQVAQTHSMAQPGSPIEYSLSSEQNYPQSPQTPHRSLHQQLSSQPLPPTEQQLKELHEHINQVYGSFGQVFVNILPTPINTPTKPARLPSHDHLDTAPMPSNLSDMAEINLDPPGSAELNFSFENPESDMGYESSSYYTSDALSPGRSPCSSPRQKSSRSFLDDVEEEYTSQMPFSGAPPLFPSTEEELNGLPKSITDSMPRSSSIIDLDVDASIEYTGIAPEDVQRFISEQDPTSGRWTCLFTGCDKTFGRRENIRSHVQTHLGDRQFRCNGCGKCFVRQHDLKRHAKIHTGSKPYKCPCSAGFARQDALTRHRQRGMCVGGFPDAVRRQAKRGRPKKNRPDMEDRVTKSSRTRRRAIASAASSSSGGSPSSDFNSPRYQSPPSYSTNEVVTSGSSIEGFGGPVSASTDPFSFENASSPYSHTSPASTNFQASSPFEGDEISMNLYRQLSAEAFTQTPPMSPSDHMSPSEEYQDSNISYTQTKSPQKSSTTPARASLSNQFTTPPTSPIESTRDDLDDLFNDFENGATCSQYDLEMKAMTDFTSFDNNEAYEMLDFM